MRIVLPLILTPLTAFADCGLYEAVEPGDGFSQIAARCDLSIDELRQLNPGLTELHPAQVMIVRLPETGPAAKPPSAGGGWAAIIGNYAAGGTCAGSERVISLNWETLSVGETACTIVERYESGNDIGLYLSQCFSEGEPVAPRDAVLGWTAGEITLSMRGETLVAQRCKDM